MINMRLIDESKEEMGKTGLGWNFPDYINWLENKLLDARIKIAFMEEEMAELRKP